MAQQVKTITSESLEAAYRALTPSQDGFTEDLMASNTIIPVLDMTADAQGTSTPQILQTAWDFSTGFNEVTSTSATIINQAGFWQVGLNAHIFGSGACEWKVAISDGLTSKPIWEFNSKAPSIANASTIIYQNFVVFLRSGDSLTGGVSASVNYPLNIWYRQIADVNGDLVNPLGFTPQ